MLVTFTLIYQLQLAIIIFWLHFWRAFIHTSTKKNYLKRKESLWVGEKLGCEGRCGILESFWCNFVGSCQQHPQSAGSMETTTSTSQPVTALKGQLQVLNVLSILYINVYVILNKQLGLTEQLILTMLTHRRNQGWDDVSEEIQEFKLSKFS